LVNGNNGTVYAGSNSQPNSKTGRRAPAWDRRRPGTGKLAVSGRDFVGKLSPVPRDERLYQGWYLACSRATVELGLEFKAIVRWDARALAGCPALGPPPTPGPGWKSRRFNGAKPGPPGPTADHQRNTGGKKTKKLAGWQINLWIGHVARTFRLNGRRENGRSGLGLLTPWFRGFYVCDFAGIVQISGRPPPLLFAGRGESNYGWAQGSK